MVGGKTLLMLNEKPALVTFTVKVTHEEGKKIYSIELMNIKNPEGKVPSSVQKRTSATSRFDILNISQIADKINSVKIKLD